MADNPTLGRARIEDVAARAGVSVATVSRALRGLSNVAPATRERVVQVANELHYRADPHASRLAAGRTHTIGMAVPLLGQWYFSQVVAGAEAVLAAEGYDLLLVGIGSGDDRKRVVREWALLQKRVDGMILVDLRMDADEVDGLVAAQAHVVTVGDRYEGFASVTVDNRAAAHQAVEHLLAQGHDERVALIGDAPGGALAFSIPGERRAGYHDAHRARGRTPDPVLDVPGDFSVEGGADGMAQLLELADPPTAVFAMSDEMAMGAVKALRDRRLRVPEDVSVIGFDDHDLAGVFGLTTVQQPVVECGGLAARFLLDGFVGQQGVDHRVEPTRLVIRETTAPVPEPEADVTEPSTEAGTRTIAIGIGAASPTAPAPTIAVTGEAVLDFAEVPGEALAFRGHPGGSPLNVAVAAARQGQPSMALTQLSSDQFGDAIVKHLVGNGVDVSLCSRSSDPTALAFVSHDEAGNALFQFVANGSADRLWDPRPRPVLPDSVRFLQVSSLTLFHEPAATTVLELVAAHAGRVTIVFDPTYRPALIPSVGAFHDALDRLLPYIHLIKPSDQDLAFLAPGRDPHAIARGWLDRGVRAVVLTAGPDGATLLRTGRAPMTVPAPSVAVVDTIGAGDTFTGTLLAALVEAGHATPDDLLHHGDAVWHDALRRAAVAAAINCTRAGCDPPTRAETVRLLA